MIKQGYPLIMAKTYKNEYTRHIHPHTHSKQATTPNVHTKSSLFLVPDFFINFTSLLFSYFTSSLDASSKFSTRSGTSSSSTSMGASRPPSLPSPEAAVIFLRADVRFSALN